MTFTEYCDCDNGKVIFRPHALAFVVARDDDWKSDVDRSGDVTIACPGCDGTGERPTAEARELMELVRTQGGK